MKYIILWVASIVLFVSCTPARAATTRSYAQKVAFAKLHPCPVTGLPVPSCKGMVIDHKKPRCAGGHDRPYNMAWSEKSEALLKDKEEVRLCAAVKSKRFAAYSGKGGLCRALEPSQWPFMAKAICGVKK